MQSLHERGRYVGLLVRGAPCGSAGGRQIVKRLQLDPLLERSEGIDARDDVAVRIHELVKTNYSAEVLDTKTKRIIGCGALSSERPL